MSSTAMIERQRAREIVDAVHGARTKALEGFRLLATAKEELGAILGEGYESGYGDSLWDDRISDRELAHQASTTDQHIATNAWRYVLRLIGLYDFMTDARKEECERQLKAGVFLSFTVENIQTVLEGLSNDMGRLLTETVTEVFDWLRPRSTWGAGALKTNKRFRVDYKVILVGVVNKDSSLWGFHLNYYRDKEVRALGRVLSLLDGQGVPHYPDDLVTQLNIALKSCAPGNEITLPYFTCRPRKNGNLAVTFTRHELIDRLNQIGADGSLGAETAA